LLPSSALFYYGFVADLFGNGSGFIAGFQYKSATNPEQDSKKVRTKQEPKLFQQVSVSGTEKYKSCLIV
jgi:hypothetical protein